MRLLKNHGFSLLEITISMAVLAIAASIGGDVVMGSMKTAVYDRAVEELNRTQQVAMIKGQSVRFVTDRIGAVALNDCFKGTSPCPPLNVYREENGVENALLPPVVNVLNTPLAVGQVRIQTDIELQATSAGVNVSVESGITAAQATIIEMRVANRKLNVFLPASLFANPEDIDWTCPPNETIIGADYTTRRAICRPYSANICAEEEPIRVFGQVAPVCQTMCNKVCPNGFANVGLYDSNCTCNLTICSYTPVVSGCSATCGWGTQTSTLTNSVPDPSCPPIVTTTPCFAGACATCGNAAYDPPGEQCDGTANCSPACACEPGYAPDGFGNCTVIVVPPLCGNGVVDTGEACDASIPGGDPNCSPGCATCNAGFTGGGGACHGRYLWIFMGSGSFGPAPVQGCYVLFSDGSRWDQPAFGMPGDTMWSGPPTPEFLVDTFGKTVTFYGCTVPAWWDEWRYCPSNVIPCLGGANNDCYGYWTCDNQGVTNARTYTVISPATGTGLACPAPLTGTDPFCLLPPPPPPPPCGNLAREIGLGEGCDSVPNCIPPGNIGECTCMAGFNDDPNPLVNACTP